MIAENPDKILPNDELQDSLNKVIALLKADISEHLSSNVFALKINVAIGVPPDKRNEIEVYNRLLQARLDRLDRI